ncbi:MAG: hypothetical protein JO053_03535 [Acidobacteria bacterium]|nr:hypothetical protein [Acidobacteriota bacterium]
MNLDDKWAERRKKGLVRYLLIDGIIYTGGPFAVVMQVIGYFLFPGDAATYGQYFASSIVWVRFILHGVLFGLVIGYVKWRRNEAAFAAGNSGVE